jgi:ribosome modulation factor
MEQAASDHGRIFAEGYLAGISGDLRSANPQKAEGIEAAAWLEGWDQGNAKREQNNARSRKRIHPLDTSWTGDLSHLRLHTRHKVTATPRGG